jgi:predicted transcriptional regulator
LGLWKVALALLIVKLVLLGFGPQTDNPLPAVEFGMSLTRCQRAILVDLLVHGDDKAANIDSRTGFHRNTVSSHMSDLRQDGYLLNKGGGVYELTDKGKSTARDLLKSGENPWQPDS